MRASASDRSIICPASLVLPRAPREPSETREKAAAWGTLVHHWAETGEVDPPWADPRETKCLEKKLLLSGVEREVWWPGMEHEVTFALLLKEAPNEQPLKLHLYEPHEIDRDNWKASFSHHWLTGTIDGLDWCDRKTMAWVDDLKTGRWPVDPTKSAQLRSYALVPWILAGCPMAWEGLVSITQWPRYPLAGQPDRTFHRLSAVDLMEHLGDLRHAAEHPEEINPTDDGCRFCECRPLCPAWRDADEDITETYSLEEDE